MMKISSFVHTQNLEADIFNNLKERSSSKCDHTIDKNTVFTNLFRDIKGVRSFECLIWLDLHLLLDLKNKVNKPGDEAQRC